MSRFSIGLAIVVALAVVVFGTVARSARPTSAAEGPRLVSMSQSAQAMQDAGNVMQLHAQAMLTEGQRTGDQELIARGEHWLSDGQALVQGGQWMSMNPTAPGSLVASPSDLGANGSWGELTRTAQQMLHDPSRAREVDLEALRWNGLAMRAEGRNMADHGRNMAEDMELMIGRHGLNGLAAVELRQTAVTTNQVGGYLEQNGQSMIDYADRLRQSMGYR
ncbi:MAG: hypothetical protein IT305_26005 [Chloroflexi bacterium]|nr:hypothetical protein [Chloroflexota bacterium]